METFSVHYGPTGVYINRSPNPDLQADTQWAIDNYEYRRRSFHAYLDAAPNLNVKYGPEVALVTEQFERDGLETSPIKVLGSQEYELASSIVAPD
jgi:hypothetical protein